MLDRKSVYFAYASLHCQLSIGSPNRYLLICCLIQQKYLPVLHLRYNILQNVKNRYTDLRSCNHYTQYSHKILFMFSIFIGFAK